VSSDELLRDLTSSGVAIDSGSAKLRMLTEISRALTYTTSLEQVTALTVERGAELLEAQAAVLMLTDAEDLLHVRATHGITEERVKRFRAPLTDELIARLQGLLEVSSDCFIAVPLVASGTVTGLLAVALRQPSTEADEWALSALADQAAVALEHARLGTEVLIEMQDRLQASAGASSAKDRALSTLAHDIRTPLGAIEGYCEILEDGLYGPINDRQREALGRVRMSGRHLLSLLDNVMDMARLNAGVIRVNMAPVCLSDVARDAVDMVQPTANAKQQSLENSALHTVFVNADHSRLRQVLINLIANAVKFTPDRGSILVGSSKRTIDGIEQGEIRVTDNGPGIAEAEHAAIFEPYYRSEGTSSSPGVGLGLAISQALIKQMGGALLLESEKGVGSSFIIRFPLLNGGTAK
jgi:phosphoserine phosphatase RsbU/P